MSDRRDNCKCGKIITWNDDGKGTVICKHCRTKYKRDSESILVHWLEEIIEQRNPYKTEKSI